MHVMAIVNPTSGGGRGAVIERELRATFEVLNVQGKIHTTGCQGGGTALGTMAVASAVDIVIVVGGDGTLSEVVDALFHEAGRRQSTETAAHAVVDLFLPRVMYIPAGTGADFARLGFACHVSDLEKVLSEQESRELDIGFVHHTQTNHIRFFVNVASLGLGSRVVTMAEQLKPRYGWLGGKAVFLLASGWSLLRLRQLPVALRSLDDDAGGTSNMEWTHTTVTSLAFCNGCYFGGGMLVAPQAEQDDGRLNVTVWREKLCGFLTGITSVYNGRAALWPSSTNLRGRRFEVVSEDDTQPALFEVDGEIGHALPAVVGVAASRLVFLTPVGVTDSRA
jgi:diacylglycerol kinase family enzyme